MLGIFVSGNPSFVNQIKNKLQKLKNKGRFIYVENCQQAQVVISEEDTVTFSDCKDTAYIYVEILRGVTGKLMAAQYIAGEKTDCFELSDLSSVLQGGIITTEMLIDRDEKIKAMSDDIEAWEDEIKGYEYNFRNARLVQHTIMDEACNLKNYDAYIKYYPKAAISGDFVVSKEIYDKLFIIFGDTTDHGLYAGEYAVSLVSLAKNYLSGCSEFNANLESFMSYMSRAAFFYHGGNEQSSCECVLCEIDEKRNIARFATFSGGNISPIIAKEDGTVIRVFDENCIFDEARNETIIKPRLGDVFYENNLDPHALPGIVEKQFNPGDEVLFYSDGFSELFSTKGMKKDQQFIYGVGNMENAVKDACEKGGNSPENIVNAVKGDIVSYGVQGLYDSSKIEDMISDDATMYSVRRKKSNG